MNSNTFFAYHSNIIDHLTNLPVIREYPAADKSIYESFGWVMVAGPDAGKPSVPAVVLPNVVPPESKKKEVNPELELLKFIPVKQ